MPIGQDAAAVIAPLVSATNQSAGTLLVDAVNADQAMVHPAVQAVCKSLLGAAATPADVPKPEADAVVAATVSGRATTPAPSQAV